MVRNLQATLCALPKGNLFQGGDAKEQSEGSTLAKFNMS